MPVIKSAIKKLRHDKKLEKENDLFRKAVEKAVKTATKSKSNKDVSAAFSLVDKAAKKGLIHKNKAARIKSTLMPANPSKHKVEGEKPAAKTPKAPAKKVTKTKKAPTAK